MRPLGDHDALQEVRLTVLDRDGPGRQPVPQDVLQGLGLQLDRLAGSDHIDALDLIEIDHLIAIARDVHLRMTADMEPVSLSTDELERIGIGICCRQPPFEDIERQRSGLTITVGNQFVSVLDDHARSVQCIGRRLRSLANRRSRRPVKAMFGRVPFASGFEQPRVAQVFRDGRLIEFHAQARAIWYGDIAIHDQWRIQARHEVTPERYVQGMVLQRQEARYRCGTVQIRHKGYGGPCAVQRRGEPVILGIVRDALGFQHASRSEQIRVDDVHRPPVNHLPKAIQEIEFLSGCCRHPNGPGDEAMPLHIPPGHGILHPRQAEGFQRICQTDHFLGREIAVPEMIDT